MASYSYMSHYRYFLQMNHSPLHSEMDGRLLFYSLPPHLESGADSWRRESRSQPRLTENFLSAIRARSVGSVAHLSGFHLCWRSSPIWSLLECFVDFNEQQYLNTCQCLFAYCQVHLTSCLCSSPIRAWTWQYYTVSCAMTRRSSPFSLSCCFGPQISFLC